MLIDEIVTYRRDPHQGLANKILKELKEKMIFDNNLEIDLDRIPTSFIKDCRTLSDMGLVIGGSIALKLYGVLDRDINDFDLFLNEKVDFEKLKDRWEETKERKKIGVSAVFDLLMELRNTTKKSEKEYEEERGLIFKAKIDHLLNSDKKIDIFNIRKNYTKVSGINIQTDIFCALDAKLKYYREKDKDDFKVVFGKMIF